MLKRSTINTLLYKATTILFCLIFICFILELNVKSAIIFWASIYNYIDTIIKDREPIWWGKWCLFLTN